MHVVIDKKSRDILHVNPAPLSQGLQGKEIYRRFNVKTMEIGSTDGPLPEHFDINKKGEIVELSPEQQVKAGLLELAPHEKIVEGIIAEKSLSEKVKDKLIELGPTQKIEGKGTDERIVEKTLSEQVKDKLITLGPNQKVVGEEIVTLTPRQMLDAKSIDLAEYKQTQIEHYSGLSFELRRAIIPDHRLQNVALGIYDEKTTANMKATVSAFRVEFYRIKGLIEKAASAKAVDEVQEKFPRKVAAARST